MCGHILCNLQSALPRCAPRVLSISTGRGGAGQDLLFAGRGSPFVCGAGRCEHPWYSLLIVLVFALEDTEKLNESIEEHFATFPLIILRFVVIGCFWKEMSYLVIFVRDKPLFDRLTFTIFIFKDINNERVFRMYPNLLISSSKISAWFTKYD